jgi:hypothetical protein
MPFTTLVEDLLSIALLSAAALIILLIRQHRINSETGIGRREAMMIED